MVSQLDKYRAAALAASIASQAAIKRENMLYDAAPDMLAALKDCREVLRRAGALGELMVVDAAIRKATGEHT